MSIKYHTLAYAREAFRFATSTCVYRKPDVFCSARSRNNKLKEQITLTVGDAITATMLSPSSGHKAAYAIDEAFIYDTLVVVRCE